MLLSSFDVTGQNDSLSQEDLEPLIPLDTFDNCYGVKAKTGFAVRYDQYAQVFFRTEVPSYNTNFVISSNVNPSLNFDIDTLHYGETESAELILKVDQAALDKVFQLTVVNSCGDPLLLKQVSTAPSNTSSVMVSHDLFYALERKIGDTSLYQVLENDSSVIFEEKLSFVQKYFFDDSLFSLTSMGTGLLDTLPVNHSGVLPCYCKMINGEPLLEPFVKDLEIHGSYKGNTSLLCLCKMNILNTTIGQPPSLTLIRAQQNISIITIKENVREASIPIWEQMMGIIHQISLHY